MKFDYGDTVCLLATLEDCEIVGITNIETVEQAETHNIPLGTVLYSVEFGDGSDALVPETAWTALPVMR